MAATDHDHEHSHDHGDHDHSHEHFGTIMASTTTITAVGTQQEGDRTRGARPCAEMGGVQPDSPVSRAVLREPALPVTEFSDDLRALTARIIRLMDDASGVGLAGNQVG